MRHPIAIGILFGITMLVTACQQKTEKSTENQQDSMKVSYEKGSFGYDLDFLNKYDSVILLQNESGLGQIIVSAKYQAKVFTSTANGAEGKSFGWVNYKAFDAAIDPHMNAYGGEDRLWLGPEGGPFSLYFKKDAEMVFKNWKTPAAIDTEAWDLIAADNKEVNMEKRTVITNYKGTPLDIRLQRKVRILENAEIEKDQGISLSPGVKSVAFTTQNSISNVGSAAWTKETGAPCLWNLDMFNPSDSTVILIPYQENASGKVATTDYFGEIPTDRIVYKQGVLFFKADGKSRGKLGLTAQRAKQVAGSYDLESGVLTITKYSVDPSKTYLNQEWTTKKDPFVGDAVNAYNDGPLADGGQMGPFYEIESVSPAAFLKPNESLTHQHAVYHFMGDKTEINQLIKSLFQIEINDIRKAFKN